MHKEYLEYCGKFCDANRPFGHCGLNSVPYPLGTTNFPIIVIGALIITGSLIVGDDQRVTCIAALIIIVHSLNNIISLARGDKV